MRGLGRIISFIANEGKFKFKSDESIRNSVSVWPGLVPQTCMIDSKKYSNDLRQLTMNLLNPTPTLRPSAKEVLIETEKGTRTDSPQRAKNFGKTPKIIIQKRHVQFAKK